MEPVAAGVTRINTCVAARVISNSRVVRRNGVTICAIRRCRLICALCSVLGHVADSHVAARVRDTNTKVGNGRVLVDNGHGTVVTLNNVCWVLFVAELPVALASPVVMLALPFDVFPVLA